MPEWPNSHKLKIQDGGGRHLEFRKNVNNFGLDKDILHQIIWEDAAGRRGDDNMTKSRNQKLIRVTSIQGRSWPGGSGGPDPPSLGQGHSRDMCKSEEFFQGGGTPLVKFGIADFTALFASLSVTFSDAVWRRHRTKVSAVC